MRRKLLLVLAFLLAICGTARGSKPAKRSRLLIFVYMCGSNLETEYGSATEDILEMEAACTNPDVTVLIMTGGAQNWRLFPGSETRIQMLKNQRRITVWTAEEESMNMGSPDTLSFFLRFGAKRYPADAYALIFWDHGAGPMEGVCIDEMHEKQRLSVSDMARALSAFSGFRWIGFDACLMSSLEVANAMNPFADYMIASEETEPASGWNYGFLSQIDPDESGELTGRKIIDAYFESREETEDHMTLSCIRLSRTDALNKALDQFFEPLISTVSEKTFPDLYRFRMKATSFGRLSPDFNDNAYDLVDLNSLVALLSDENHSAEAVRKALNDAVVCHRSNVSNTSGLSIYHPFANKQNYIGSWRGRYTLLSGSASYAGYVFRMGDLLAGEDMISWAGLRTEITAAYEDGAVHLACPLTEEQSEHTAFAKLIILSKTDIQSVEEAYSIVGTFPAEVNPDGMITGAYDGVTFYIGPGMRNGPVSFYLADDFSHPQVSAVFGKKDTAVGNDFDECMLVLERNPEQDGMRIVQYRFWDEMTQTHTGRIPYQPEKYGTVTVRSYCRVMPEISDRGTLIPYSEWEQYGGVTLFDSKLSDFQITAVRQPPPDGRLYAMFEITDVHQNRYCSYPAEIPNPDRKELRIMESVQETEYGEFSLSGTLTGSSGNRDLYMELKVTNDTDTETRYDLNNVVFNGSRYDPHAESFTLQPQQSCRRYITIPMERLLLLQELSSVTLMLNVYPDNDLSRKYSLPVTFAVEDCGLAGITDEPEILGETVQDGIDLKILKIEFDTEILAYRILMYMDNHSDTVFCPERFSINGLQESGSYTHVFPGTSAIWTEYFYNDLTAFLPDMENNLRVSISTPPVVLDHVLERSGFSRISEIRLTDAGGRLFLIPLGEPLPLTDYIPDELLYYYGMIPDDSAGPIEWAPLADRDGLKVAAGRILVADSSFFLLLKTDNRSGREQKLEIRFTEVNGEATEEVLYSYSFQTVMPDSSYTALAVFAPYGRLNPDPLPENTAVQSIKGMVADYTGGTETEFLIRFPDGVFFAAPEGTMVEAGQLQVTVRSLPRKREGN